jgi:class 3 adenylate cyclase
MAEAVMENREKVWRFVRSFIFEIPPGVTPENQNHYLIHSIISYFALLAHTSIIPLFGFLGVKQLALFNIVGVLIWVLAIVLNRNGFHFFSMIISVILVCSHQTLCVVFIGWNAGFQYYLLALPFGLFLMPHGNNLIKAVMTGICLMNFSLLDYFFRTSSPLFILAPFVLNVFNYSNLAVFVTLASFACYFFNAKVHTAETEVRKEQKKAEKAYNLLSKYVAPQLAHTIYNGHIDSIWKHSRKKLTLFFSDIQDFTMATDSMEPEDMSELLNEYLKEMNLIVNKYRGTLAQVIGDALYVFFGAPESNTDKDHAVRCVKMAIDMQKKMETLNARWYDRGIDHVLKIRCGINTGMVTVGGYGSSERKEYTAMGMQTNIAAKIEEDCEPGNILISHTTWALVKDEVPCSEKGNIKVKGLRRPIRVYSIVNDAG